ncbi:lipopolysaccharide biosynthesis protein [Vibrio aestuarianus]|uniref:lipopolysaccharide biosynthesis protein n=1 Tax=Vibrio aestuarianus TaxID=28171 RepID=UPI00237CDD0B|nr:lipopolysaccharide biosynthesis protein [Vibrio aestuarianus]MDE1264181.1 lipopolysaccharide biosynthesis protein [Vibrio aestuarianus]MDE1296050.1 lipopolysaccharide biosynthesis protein [Vibrio aestuarianus]
MLKKILKEDFFRNVGLLASGTAIGQVVSIIALPFLTRLYTPESFAQLSLFLSLVSICSTIACLRFEIAIPLSRNENEKNDLSILAFFSITGFSITLAILAYFVDNYIDDSRVTLGFIILAICTVFLLGLFNLLDFLVVKDKNFKLSSKTKILQSLIQNSSQGLLGFTKLSSGLLIGYILYVVWGVFSYRRYLGFLSKRILSLDFHRIKKTAVSYRNYPLYSTFQSLFNVSSIQVPIIIIAIYGISPDAGYLMLAIRIIQAPLSLLSNSVSQVYISKAHEERKKNNLYNYTVDIIKKLVKLGVLPLVTIGVSAPYIFPFIFGPEWKMAGVYTLYLTPWFCMQLISSPVSYSMDVLSKQKIGMVFQFIGSLFRIMSVIIPLLYMKDWMIIGHAMSGFVFYTAYLIIIMLLLNKDQKIVSV